MKVLVYSAKDFEMDNLKKANGEKHKMKFVPEALDATTAVMAAGFSRTHAHVTMAHAQFIAASRHFRTGQAVRRAAAAEFSLDRVQS